MCNQIDRRCAEMWSKPFQWRRSTCHWPAIRLSSRQCDIGSLWRYRCRSACNDTTTPISKTKSLSTAHVQIRAKRRQNCSTAKNEAIGIGLLRHMVELHCSLSLRSGEKFLPGARSVHHQLLRGRRFARILYANKISETHLFAVTQDQRNECRRQQQRKWNCANTDAKAEETWSQTEDGNQKTTGFTRTAVECQRKYSA